MQQTIDQTEVRHQARARAVSAAAIKRGSRSDDPEELVDDVLADHDWTLPIDWRAMTVEVVETGLEQEGR